METSGQVASTNCSPRSRAFAGPGEQELSEREERFELRRRTLGFVLSPLAAVVVFLLPLDIPQTQHTVAAVLAPFVCGRIFSYIPAVFKAQSMLTRDTGGTRTPELSSW